MSFESNDEPIKRVQELCAEISRQQRQFSFEHQRLFLHVSDMIVSMLDVLKEASLPGNSEVFEHLERLCLSVQYRNAEEDLHWLGSFLKTKSDIVAMSRFLLTNPSVIPDVRERRKFTDIAARFESKTERLEHQLVQMKAKLKSVPPPDLLLSGG